MQSRDRIENVHTYPSVEIVLSKLVAIICDHSCPGKGLIQVDDPRSCDFLLIHLIIVQIRFL